jgi:hypothetical protein
MLHILSAHHLVGQEFERPALPPIGGLATRQVNQLGFSFAIQTPPFGTFPGEAEGSSHLQVPLHKPLLDPNYGAATDIQGLSNLPIGVTWVALTDASHISSTCATT